MVEAPDDHPLDHPLDRRIERVTEMARDGMYVAVGLGLLALNRAQAARRDIADGVEHALPGVTDAVVAELREIALDAVAQTKAVLGVPQ